MAGILELLTGKKAAAYTIDPKYRELRNKLFHLRPQDIRIHKRPDQPVWGFLMDSGYEDFASTLLALKDGTVSFYLTSGFTLIGLGQHTVPARISQELLESLPQYLPQTSFTADQALPTAGLVRFYLFTFDGVRMVEAKADDLENDWHLLSPLFHKIHKLIAASRELHEAHH